MSAWWAGALLLAGGVLLVIAAWGVIRLPDALSRQHAATKAGTLGVALVCLGAVLEAGTLGWALRLLAILAFLLATLPVASHMLARAALREAGAEDEVRRAPLVGDPPDPSP